MGSSCNVALGAAIRLHLRHGRCRAVRLPTCDPSAV